MDLEVQIYLEILKSKFGAMIRIPYSKLYEALDRPVQNPRDSIRHDYYHGKIPIRVHREAGKNYVYLLDIAEHLARQRTGAGAREDNAEPALPVARRPGRPRKSEKIAS